MKRKNKEKELEDLLKKMLEVAEGIKDFNPVFNIGIKSNDENSAKLTLQGNTKSILFGLTELIIGILEETNATKEDIMFAVETALDEEE